MLYGADIAAGAGSTAGFNGARSALNSSWRVTRDRHYLPGLTVTLALPDPEYVPLVAVASTV